jgi:3-hydroxyisobutyrate dehydrogenase-like beta-hydroxyacid dehydrogenase
MSNSAERTIAWIGTGKMGLPMCRNLLKAGFALTAYNPTRSKAEPLAALGAKLAGDVAAAAAAAPIVVSMISDDKALRMVALGPDGVLARASTNAIYVDMSTVTPSASAEVAAEALKRKIPYLRAPVSGGVALADTAKLTVLASGPEAAFTRAKPMFEAVSAKQLLVGDAEQARFLKLGLNMLVGATGALLGEVLALGRRGGLDWATMLDAINQSAVASPLLGYKSGPLKVRDFTPTFSTMQMMKDFDLLLATGKDNAVPMPLAALIRQLYEISHAQGQGALDFFSLIQINERLAGLAPEQYMD